MLYLSFPNVFIGNPGTIFLNFSDNMLVKVTSKWAKNQTG